MRSRRGSPSAPTGIMTMHHKRLCTHMGIVATCNIFPHRRESMNDDRPTLWDDSADANPVYELFLESFPIQ
jgi:hypothetical protein